MKKAKKFLVFSLCLVLCFGALACDNGANNSTSESGSSNTHVGGVYTEFTTEEEDRFLSEFGFVIPFIQNTSYRVEDYVGDNGDLMAYENGLVFIAEGLTEEDCEAYVDNLKDDENYSFEYPQDGYYYFSRFVDDQVYFIKVEYYWMKTQFGLTVYTYSYTFEDADSSDTATDSESSDTSTDIPDEPTVGFKYEKHSDSCSIIGFYGDEDGIVEIPDFYEGLPVRYIRGNAFYGREDIVELIVSDNVYSIEGDAFMLCCNLEKVTLGNSLTLIDMQAFFGCEKLEEITIPATVTFIGAGAFKKCTKLKSVYLGNPEGWHTSSNLHEDFPIEDMSNAETVATYLTETYVSKGWMKD